MARRQFDRQFKINAVKLVQQSGYTRAEAANSLGVSTSHISGWINQFGQLDETKPVGDGSLVAEIRQLREENAKLKVEREILKKAATFFAKEQP